MPYYHHHYVIDWDKVLTLDDMKRLVKAMNITFERDCDHDRLQSIMDLVHLEEKPKIGIAVMD